MFWLHVYNVVVFEITTVLENRSHKHFSDGYVVEIRTRTALGEV